MTEQVFAIQCQTNSPHECWGYADNEFFNSYEVAEARVLELYNVCERNYRIVQLQQSSSTATLQATRLLRRWELRYGRSYFNVGKLFASPLDKAFGVVDHCFTNQLIVYIDLPLNHSPTQEHANIAVEKFTFLSQLHHIQEYSRLKLEEKEFKANLLTWYRISVKIVGDWPYALAKRPIQPFYLPEDSLEALEVKYRVKYVYKYYDNTYHSTKEYDYRLDGFKIHKPGILVRQSLDNLLILVSPEIESVYQFIQGQTKDQVQLWNSTRLLAQEILKSESSFVSKLE
jgi:hypothetical protein